VKKLYICFNRVTLMLATRDDNWEVYKEKQKYVYEILIIKSTR